MDKLFFLLLACILVASIPLPCSASWKPLIVQQTNGNAPRKMLKADIQIVSEQMNEVTAVPYITYMPDKDQILMLFGYQAPHVAALMSSSDRGATWSKLWFMRTDDKGIPSLGLQTGLSYLGNGRVISGTGYVSEDYGLTWPEYRPVPTSLKDKVFYGWDPILIDRDPKTKKITQLTIADYRQVDPNDVYSSHASVFFSTDEGLTWTPPLEVPQWDHVNEVAFVRAKNKDLIAACRTDAPERFKTGIDHYCGLAISISKDNGKTWSELNRLYEWGRHHPSMVVMKNGDIVMTYVVRLGYKRSAEGFPQFGIEAIISRDNGKTWDLDHKYILASWKGNRTGPDEWWTSSQATSTVLMPDGSLITAFGTGNSAKYRSSIPTAGAATTEPEPLKRDIGLIHWKLNNRGLNKDHTLSDAPWNSIQRNEFDITPETVK